MSKKRIGKYVIFLNDKLGQGAFAQVVRGIDDETKEMVAAKIVSKDMIQQDQYTKNAFYSEIQIIKRLKSNNIIRFHEVHETKNNFYIMLELCNGGTLRGKLKNLPVDQKTAKGYLIQLLNGFGQLVKNGVTHRDLKPDNILIHDDVLKIADFGFAKASENNSFLKTIVGTPAYMAPQILNEEKYTYKCDIWSLGVIIYQMMVGKIPWIFKEKNLNAIKDQIFTRQISFPENLQISDTMKEFILGCLCIDQAKRLDWDQIFLHPLFGSKFKRNFQNKKEGATQVNFIISNFRMELHSKNINITKIMSKYPQKLSSQEFQKMIKSIMKGSPSEDYNIFFNYIAKNGYVQMGDFRQFLIKHQCRLTGIDLGKLEPTNMKESFLLISRLKDRIDSMNMDIYKLYSSKDYEKKDAMSLQLFDSLIREIDNTFTKAEIDILYKQFDVNQDGAISFSQFYQGMCKIAEVVPAEP